MSQQFYLGIFLIYILVTFFVTLLITVRVKPSNLPFVYFIVFWMSYVAIFKSPFAWRFIPQIYLLKNIESNLGWALVIYFIIHRLSTGRSEIKRNKPTPTYEILIIFYLCYSIILYIIHNRIYSDIATSKMLYFSQIYTAAICTYIGIREILDKKTLRIIIQITLYMVISTSIIGVIQFFIDPNFLKFGHFHMAIPGYVRTSGIFRQPHDNGIFSITGIFLSYYYIKNRLIKTIVISVVSVNLICTFSRGLWITFIIVFLYHLSYFYIKKLKKILFYTGFGSISIIVIAGSYIASSKIFESGAFTERIFQDTVSVRFGYYFKVLEAIPARWFIGYGDVENNPVYFDKMVELNQSLLWALGRMGGIHNIILEELFLRGIPATIVFILFFYAFVRFSLRQTRKYHSYIFIIPSYFLLSFFLYFQSVSGFLISTSGFMCIFYAAVVSGIYYNDVDISEYRYNSLDNTEDIKKGVSKINSEYVQKDNS